MVDDNTHDDVGGSVKHTGDQHDQTHRHDGDARVVGVKQGQQGGDHAKDDVAGRVTAAVGDPSAYRQALGCAFFFIHYAVPLISFFGAWSKRSLPEWLQILSVRKLGGVVYALAGFLLPVCAGFDAPQSPCIQGMRLLFFTVIDAAGRRLAFFAWFSSIDQLPEIQFFPFGAGGRKYHPLVWCEFNQYLLTAFVGFVFSMDKSNKKPWLAVVTFVLRNLSEVSANFLC